MSRLHKYARGRSKSRKPHFTGELEDFGVAKEEIERLIVDYARKGYSPAQIGQILKDKHGIKSVRHATGKRVVKILEEHAMKPVIPSDLLDLIKKAVNVRKHLEQNHKDIHNKRNLALIESKIWRLVRYYRDNNKLPASWKYDPETAELLIKGNA
ncbi:MAG: 30S ribosomal protein S15 [Candidatus Micrarchaeota archaeon]|nr:MAG: 30S ribosomal protein S15 [Candidatus Micrarchaeota archaeon]